MQPGVPVWPTHGSGTASPVAIMLILKLPSLHYMLRTHRSLDGCHCWMRERPMFLGGFRHHWRPGAAIRWPGRGCPLPSARAVQPFGEFLLQICCRCSKDLLKLQFLIEVGARPRALVLVASSSFHAINRFSVSSYGSEDVALRRWGEPMWRSLCGFAAAALLAYWVRKRPRRKSPAGFSECPISTAHSVSICTISLIASS